MSFPHKRALLHIEILLNTPTTFLQVKRLDMEVLGWKDFLNISRIFYFSS
jgi:hypothetical protein